jgi:hypothetical protein
LRKKNERKAGSKEGKSKEVRTFIRKKNKKVKAEEINEALKQEG